MNTCINCGSNTDKQGFIVICNDCEEASKRLTALLQKGIVLEFSDGTTEMIKDIVPD